MDRNSLVRWIASSRPSHVRSGSTTSISLEKKSGARRSAGHGRVVCRRARSSRRTCSTSEPGEPAPPPPPGGEVCRIRGNRFEAELASRGAGLTHFVLTDARYAGTASEDMSTTPDHERWRNLRTLVPRASRDAAVAGRPGAIRPLRLEARARREADRDCRKFTYADDRVRIVKTISAGERPFELEVDTTITNLADSPKRHADVDRGVRLPDERAEVAGQARPRLAPFQTGLECARTDDKRRAQGEGRQDLQAAPVLVRGAARRPVRAAIANYYFAQALVPLDVQPGEPGTGDEADACAVLAEQWYGADQKPDDDKAGAIYHARLDYPARTLDCRTSRRRTGRSRFFEARKSATCSPRRPAACYPRLAGHLINLGTFSIGGREGPGHDHHLDPRPHGVRQLGPIAIIVLTIGLKTASASSPSPGSRSRARSRCVA